MASGEGLSPPEKSENDETFEPFTYKSGAPLSLSASTMDGMLSRRKDIPDDLACFLQQQKQRQARQETTMRSFPTSGDMDQDKIALDQKKKRHQHEDPLSHRIIEKRRRDRMNNCLADLSRLIPSSYLRKGRGRIEKTEIIEMAIKHIRHLQSHPCTRAEGCELESEIKTGLNKASTVESFRVGYHECLTETMHFLVEKEGLYAGNSFCVRLMTHLQKHFDKLGRASTSEIHSVVGRTWAGTNLPGEKRDASVDRDRERRQGDMGVKSEFGMSSEESGYKSETQSMREREGAESVHAWPRSEADAGDLEPSDLPSDLSLGQPSGQGEDRDEARLAEDLSMASNLYKFKSSIRQRFHSSRSCDDEKDLLVPEKRSRLDSASTDRDPDHGFDVELDSVNRRDSYSPGPEAPTFPRHEADQKDGPGDIKPPVPGHHIPVFALSPRGSFYVPISVNSANLEHFLPLLSDSTPGPLHPVTISVKFCPSFRPTPAPAMIPVDQSAHEPGPSSNSDWRNSGRSGVIQPPQSVIRNWRQDAP